MADEVRKAPARVAERFGKGQWKGFRPALASCGAVRHDIAAATVQRRDPRGCGTHRATGIEGHGHQGRRAATERRAP